MRPRKLRQPTSHPAPVRLRSGMRGGATGAPPASRSRHHHRSRPAPPSPFSSQRAVEGPAAHAWKLDQHPASRPRTPAAKPTPPAIRAPPELSVRARSRCSSRASLPLTPQADTPTATIGMRPATTLRTKTKLDSRLLRAVGSPRFSYASSAARVPATL